MCIVQSEMWSSSLPLYGTIGVSFFLIPTSVLYLLADAPWRRQEPQYLMSASLGVYWYFLASFYFTSAASCSYLTHPVNGDDRTWSARCICRAYERFPGWGPMKKLFLSPYNLTSYSSYLESKENVATIWSIWCRFNIMMVCLKTLPSVLLKFNERLEVYLKRKCPFSMTAVTVHYQGSHWIYRRRVLVKKKDGILSILQQPCLHVHRENKAF